MPTTWNAIYLGNTGTFNIDPTEFNNTSENAAALVGLNIGDETNPLYERIVSVTALDGAGSAGVLETSRPGNGADRVSYTLPGATSTTTATFEGMGVYEAEITFFDGTTGVVSAVIFQDEAFNLFLAPEVTANADSALYQSGPIRSISITSLTNNASNLTANRQGADFVTCFAEDTLIRTPRGLRPIKDLQVGALVETVDDGAQPVRWIGSQTITAAGAPKLKPVRIGAGALGEGLPERDLLVSQQHRILVRSAVAREMFGADEVLVAAKHLLAVPGIEIAEDVDQVTYVHFLFDRHQLVIAEGAVTESMFTGPMALKAVTEEARAEILTIFPQLAEIGEGIETPDPVRRIVNGRQGREMAQRHAEDSAPVYAG